MDEHVNAFTEIPEDFFPKNADDKIVDISSGRHFNVIVTESGKVYGSGSSLYD